jgi:hypothetical protein
MNRDKILEMIRAQLVELFQLDPARITLQTRLRTIWTSTALTRWICWIASSASPAERSARKTSDPYAQWKTSSSRSSGFCSRHDGR